MLHSQPIDKILYYYLLNSSYHPIKNKHTRSTVHFQKKLLRAWEDRKYSSPREAIRKKLRTTAQTEDYRPDQNSLEKIVCYMPDDTSR